MVKRIDLASQLSITKMIPDERSNQLIVVANEQAYAWLLTIMKKLDVPIEGGGDGRFHIYYCENANCDELAATLSAVTGRLGDRRGGGPPHRRGPRCPARPRAGARAPAPGAAGQQPSQLFEGDVRVTFDAATNSLIVYSSLKDFQSLRRVIEKLDAPRKQVFVEAMILEVLLDKSRDLGVAYHGGMPPKPGRQGERDPGRLRRRQDPDPGRRWPATWSGLAGAVLRARARGHAPSRLFGTQVDIPSFGVLVKLAAEEQRRQRAVDAAPADHEQPGGRDLGRASACPSRAASGRLRRRLPGQQGGGRPRRSAGRHRRCSARTSRCR